MVVHKNTTFRSDRINKMATIGDYSVWPIFKKIFLKFSINFHKTLQEWLLDGLQQKYKFSFRLMNKMAAKWIILIGRISNIFSETTGPNLTKLCRNDVWMILYKNTTFRSGWTKKMAARANSRF